MASRPHSPSSRAALIVVAAGTGRRLGAPVHKALVDLDGQPLVEHTLRHLLSLPNLDPVVLVGHENDRQELAALLARLPRPVQLVEGGARRQDSVAAGLQAVAAQCDADPSGDTTAPSVVLVHDGARPFVPLAAIEPLIAAASDPGCALLAVPVTDTLKRGQTDRPNQVDATVPRDGLWAAQTPQAFDRALLAEQLAQASQKGQTMTDEAGMFEAAGLTVRFVEGSPLNFKVTTQDDLLLARALLPKFVAMRNP
ncbi:MAG: 2-C-methyl-D-erythritol 4-phosphate cytidylyltransferase [Pseudohongiellaceae bacterium]|jgi:2-C-methyl-D-erythritol 4-phosphate cytidylyltransferase